MQDIEIAGTPRLYAEPPGTGAGYNAARIVFRTRPHLHIARQVIVEVLGTVTLAARRFAPKPGSASVPRC